MVDYDFLVIGAGILGLSTACYLKEMGRESSVCVIDRFPDAGQGNTARSVGGFRRGIFTSRINRILVETSVDHYMDAERRGEHEFGMRRIGYLILLTERRMREIGEHIQPLIKQGKASLLSGEELKEKMGMETSFKDDEEAQLLGMEDIKYGLLAPECGQLDVEKLISYYKERCEACNVEFIMRREVKRLILSPRTSLGIPNEPRVWQDKIVSGVELENGEEIKARKVIVAAGIWTPNLLDPIGVDCMVKPKKRQLAVVRASTQDLKDLLSRGALDGADEPPMTFFPKGLYLVPRKHEGCFWVGLTDEIGRPYAIDMEPEERFYYDNAYPMLVKYYPQFKDARPENMWAGCYSMNNLDGNPIIFNFLNCVVVTGGSGSGAMKADAIGRIAAALALGMKVAELHGGVPFDVSVLGVENRRVDKEYLIL